MTVFPFIGYLKKKDGTGDKIYKLLRNFVFVTIQHNEAGLCKNCDKLFHLQKTGKPFSVTQMDIECLVGYLEVIVP
jgi:hypothetical protein